MKRSKMISLIRRGLTVIQNGIDENNQPRFDMKNSLEAAEFLLDKIEESGMLPPYLGWRTDELDQSGEFEWEPEEE